MSTKYQPDEVIGDTLVEIKTGLDTIGKFRTAIVQLAYALTEKGPQSTALLVLADPKLTGDRINQEWGYAGRTLNPQIMGRLTLVRFVRGDFQGLPQDLAPDIRSRLDGIVRKELGRGGTRVPTTRTYYEILKILIHQWLNVSGPMTAHWLATTAGCSYPTVAGALERLGASIKRHSDRRFELAHFPRDEWARLVAVSDRARATMRFADRSGQPRSPDSLLNRVQQLDRPDIAIGGVLGAKHYHPQLDLVGNPRLDLTLHSPGRHTDLSFVKKLDPALEKTGDAREPASLVLHFIRREATLFQKKFNGLHWADPVECALDLHEARLESQALEFLQSFPAIARTL